MKNFWKLLGIIALVAVIGFSMAACSDHSSGNDDDDDKKPGGNTDVVFPEDLVPDQGTLGKVGTWKEADANTDLFIQNASTGAQVTPTIDGNFPDIYSLVSVTGKTIKVKGAVNKTEVTLCTDYTIDTNATPKTLTITGGTGDFAQFNGKTLVFKAR